MYDFKKRLFLFKFPKRAALILASLVGFFLVWDVMGIILDVFFTNQQYVSGLYVVTKDLPIEEFLFLTHVCYFSVLLSLTLESPQ